MANELKCVVTTNSRYVGLVQKEEDKYRVDKALEVSGKDMSDVYDIARSYVSSELEDTLVDLELSREHVESVSGNKELNSAIRIWRGFIPQAEKKVRAKAIMKELSDMVEGMGGEEE